MWFLGRAKTKQLLSNRAWDTLESTVVCCKSWAGETLHTVDFGGGRVETIHLAKRAGGKGAKFHIAGEGEGAASGPLSGSGIISYHAAATPERNQSRLTHRAGQPSGAK